VKKKALSCPGSDSNTGPSSRILVTTLPCVPKRCFHFPRSRARHRIYLLNCNEDAGVGGRGRISVRKSHAWKFLSAARESEQQSRVLLMGELGDQGASANVC